MEQLILDIASKKDAALIKELFKRFKGVEVNNFSTALTQAQMRKRIEAGIKDADAGNMKPWKDVKAGLMKRLKAKRK